MGKLIGLKGAKYNNWTVLKEGEFKNRKKYWICICDCGTVKNVESYSLTHNKSKNCVKCRKTSVKHGMSHSKIYGVWHAMIQRCSNKKDKAYKNYGGRGINVCKTWKKFDDFYQWAKENGYKEGLTLDRIDNEKGYSNNNCRWIIFKEQQSNKRTNRYLEHKGQVATLSEWAEKIGIKTQSLLGRINRHGVENALSIQFKLRRGTSFNDAVRDGPTE